MLSISAPIDRSPRAYYLAFAQTETDEGDLTYFILHQLAVIQSAVEDLLALARGRAQRARDLSRRLAGLEQLNPRQRAVLEHAARHPRESYTIEGHAASHGVHYQTARSDLVDLVARGMLVAQRVGKGKRFRVSERVERRVRGRG